MKNKQKIDIIRSLNKIKGVYFLIPAAFILILYFLLPFILNYPPNSIDNQFQKDVDGLIYSHQFVFLSTSGIFVFIIFLLKDLSKIKKLYLSIDENNNIQKNIDKIIQITSKTPMKIYLIQILVPIILIPSFIIIIGTETVVAFKISIVFILFFSLSAVISFVLSQKEFQKIIINLFETNKMYENKIIKKTKRTSISTKIMLEIVPLILIALLFTSILAYIMNTKVVGDLYHEIYKSQLQKEFWDEKYTNKEDIFKKIKMYKYKPEEVTFFIIEENGDYFTSDGTKLTDFFVNYALRGINENRTYEYYCIDREGTFISIQTLSGETYLVGLAYDTYSPQLLIALIIAVIILFVIIFLILLYIASKLSKDIELIRNSLQKISEDESIERMLIVTVNDETGELTDAYNKIQQLTIDHIKEIEDSRGKIVEQERLASLGQMIGGIAHNLKTPILSIAGAAEGIKDLSDEMDESLITPTVTLEDKKEILEEQLEWVEKIKVHLEYMNDIITVVKGQATTFTTDRIEVFTVKDLFKNVEILTAHEFKNSLTKIEIINNVSKDFVIKGDFNSLLQIVNNVIVNAIQSYEGKPNNKVRLIANIGDKSDDLIISVQDYGKGMSKDVQNKLFKQMVTTKGKYGTGLGLYMSYSTIKGKFSGDIRFESEEGKGTIFHIIVPMQKKDDKTVKTKIISEHIPMSVDDDIDINENKREDIYIKNEEEELKEKENKKVKETKSKIVNKKEDKKNK